MPRSTRREILAAMSCALGGAALNAFLPSRAGAIRTMPMSRIHFGTQINAFPINPSNFDTFMGALAQVKQIGYQGFESGYRNVEQQFNAPEEARKKIEATGLTFFGIHIFMANSGYDQQTLVAPQALYEQVGRGGVALGAKHLILSGLPAPTPEQLKLKVANLTRAGAFAKSIGIKLAYHNHWPEFESKIGEMEALYTQTDPELVHFVLDCGHAFRGGANVPAFIRQHQNRIVAVHLRDYKREPNNVFRLTTLGTGDLPLRQIADTLKEIGWSGWAETEEEREDHAQTGAAVLVPAYKAMKGAFAS